MEKYEIGDWDGGSRFGGRAILVEFLAEIVKQ